jgi:hypothetical protein
VDPDRAPATEQRRADVDGLLVPDAEPGRTRLSWLGVGPTSATPAAVKAEPEKLAYLRRIDAHTLDLSATAAQAAPIQPPRRGPRCARGTASRTTLSRRRAQ